MVPALINPAVSVEMIEEMELNKVAKRFVEVLFVIVEFKPFKFVLEILVAERFVLVALVIVAFVRSTPLKFSVPTFRFEIVAEAIVVVEIVVVPIRLVVDVEMIEPAIN